MQRYAADRPSGDGTALLWFIEAGSDKLFDESAKARQLLAELPAADLLILQES